MPDTLAVDIKASFSWLFSEALNLNSVNDNGKLEYAQSLTDGVSADQADLIFHDQRSVGGGTNEDLDLTALVHSIYGSIVTYNFAKVKAILVVNLSTTAADVLRVGGAGAGSAFATPFNGSATAQVELPADGCLLLVSRKNGWAVTPGTGDVLRIQNPGGSAIAYRIAIVGTTA
jgi:hypothetical protein